MTTLGRFETPGFCRCGHHSDGHDRMRGWCCVSIEPDRDCSCMGFKLAEATADRRGIQGAPEACEGDDDGESDS